MEANASISAASCSGVTCCSFRTLRNWALRVRRATASSQANCSGTLLWTVPRILLVLTSWCDSNNSHTVS